MRGSYNYRRTVRDVILLALKMMEVVQELRSIRGFRREKKQRDKVSPRDSRKELSPPTLRFCSVRSRSDF